MALRVKIPNEIKDYKEQIMFGMSWIQLGCVTLSILIAILITVYCVVFLKTSTDTAGWFIIILVIPILAIGFYRPKGLSFLTYVKIIHGYNSKKSIVLYQTKSINKPVKVKKKLKIKEFEVEIMDGDTE